MAESNREAVARELFAASEEPVVETSLPVPQLKVEIPLETATELTKLVHEQSPAIPPQPVSIETSHVIIANEIVEPPSPVENFFPPQVKVFHHTSVPEKENTADSVNEVVILPADIITADLSSETPDTERDEVIAAKHDQDITEPPYEPKMPEVVEINVERQEELLPEFFEEFIDSVTNEDQSEKNLQDQIETFIDLLDVETNKEEAKQVTETFVEAVADIKETLESALEVTEEQVDAVINAVVELLQLTKIEPSLERITQIISMTLGEEFVSRHLDLINDRIVDELGTHERRIWTLSTVMATDETTSPTLLGRIALQLGLSLQQT